MPYPANIHKDPKVLIVDLSKSYGGASTRVISLLKNLPPGSAALAGLKNSPITRAAKESGVPVYTVGSTKFDGRIAARLTKIIRQGGYQLVDTHNIQSKLWGSLAVSITGIGFVSTIHSWYAHEHGKGSLKGWFYTALELMTNRNLGRYIVVSQKDREKLIQSDINPAQIDLIYNGVSIDPSAVPDYRQELQTQFGIPKNGLICAAVGRLVPVKGHEILIEAFSLFASKEPNFHCIIVGDGEMYSKYAQKIRSLGLEDRVHLLGYQNRETVYSIVKSCDIFVMPSFYEGTPIALLEAGALGKAVIASRVGGIPELVVDGEHAVLVNPKDPRMLSEAILRLGKNPEMLQAFGKAAQKRVQEKFNAAVMVQLTQQTYQQVWANKSLNKD